MQILWLQSKSELHAGEGLTFDSSFLPGNRLAYANEHSPLRLWLELRAQTVKVVGKFV